MAKWAWIALLAIFTPIAGFAAGAGLYQGWLGWQARNANLLADATTRANVAIGLVATFVWIALLFAPVREIQRPSRLIPLLSFLGISALWLWVGIRQLIVL